MDIAIILAAGEGTRMRSDRSKVLHTVLNRPMLEYVLKASRGSQAQKHVIIVGKNHDAVRKVFGERDLSYVKQEIGPGIPYGTGYAVKLCEAHFRPEDQVMVLSGDIPLIRGETLARFLAYHKEQENDATVLTAWTEDPRGYGRIVKDAEGNFRCIVEDRDCTEEQKEIHEFNSGVYIFRGEALRRSLALLEDDNDQGELYLTDCIGHIHAMQGKVDTFFIEEVEEVSGVNSKVQLAQVEKVMRRRVNEFWMNEGVVMENPENIFIEPGVEIGRDTRIGSGVYLTGTTRIGSRCLLQGDTHIHDSILEDEVKIYSSTIDQATVGKGSDVGPYARLRPHAKLGERVHIGNFVEVKNATLGDGTKAGHLAYVGDADLGENINVGCGVVFVNYNGKEKFRSHVGDGAFLGSNANLVAPVSVAPEAYIAAGSTITENVESGDLAIARARQVSVRGWVKRKNLKK